MARKKLIILLLLMLPMLISGLPKTSAYLSESWETSAAVTGISFYDSVDISTSTGLYIMNKSGRLVSDKRTVPIEVKVTNKLQVGMDVRLLGSSFSNGITPSKLSNTSFNLSPGTSGVITLENLEGRNLSQGLYYGTLELEFSLNPGYSLTGLREVSFECRGMK